MAALAAVVLFALALILHLIGGHGGLVVDFELAGFLCLALALLWPVFGWTVWPGRRSQ